MIWHTLPVEQIISLTGSSLNGINESQAVEALEKFGPNEIKETESRPLWKMILRQFGDVMILILIAAAVISGLIGDITDTLVILIIVLLNALIGFIQEYKAEHAIEALRKMAALQATVVRNGLPKLIQASQLVPGDIVVLEAGNAVPADLRLLEAHGLRIDESALTGESVAADKQMVNIESAEIALGDRFNMAFKGTIVINGRGKGLVIATGMQTEVGLIARMLQGKEMATPLQVRMADFGKKLSIAVLAICTVLFVVGLLRGEQAMPMLLIAISLAVAAIPESLPALITITLARGAKRLVANNALIRKLPAVETLGSVTYICTDKTGTLTQNKMTVMGKDASGNQEAMVDGKPLFELAQVLNQDASYNPEKGWMGDPTEIAVSSSAAETYGMDWVNGVQAKWKRVQEFPFDADRKCMTTIHQFNDQFLLITKGAVEAVVQRLGTSDARDEILEQATILAQSGMRVLAYAYKWLPKHDVSFSIGEAENELNYLGLIYMMDPPREEIFKAIQECKSAGIKPVMITGDHPATATAIAREIGLLDKGRTVLTGIEMARLAPEVFGNMVEKVGIFARVSPEQKLNIVQALQRRNQFVAMTGDGVNDAPSLKTANIGIAMGVSGTDVSKEAAHMILLDDNFATIVKAVKEGRRIYDNIRKFVKYALTCNGAEILTLFMAPIMGLPMPLLPIQILWINLVTDGLPGLALAGEPPEKNVMNRPPRHPGESLFSRGIGSHIIWVALLMASVALATQALAISLQMHWQTMIFTVLSVSQLGHALAIRSDHAFLLRQGVFSNPALALAVGFTFLLQMAVIYLPIANQVFHTQPLSLKELGLALAFSSIIFHAVEIEKLVKGLKRKLPAPDNAASME